MTIIACAEGAVSSYATTPMSPTIGAMISGVDLSEPLDDNQIGEVRQALLDYKLRSTDPRSY